MMINWLKGLFCKKHEYIPRFFGITCTGYICVHCGHQYYEKKHGKK